MGKWSRDTLLQLIRHRPAEAPSTPRVLGVDDWAKRKGQTLADWLSTHTGVEIICCDRAGAYAEGAQLGAQQVADRFHLIINLRNAVERSLEKYRAQLTMQVTRVTRPS